MNFKGNTKILLARTNKRCQKVKVYVLHFIVSLLVQKKCKRKQIHFQSLDFHVKRKNFFEKRHNEKKCHVFIFWLKNSFALY